MQISVGAPAACRRRDVGAQRGPFRPLDLLGFLPDWIRGQMNLLKVEEAYAEKHGLQFLGRARLAREASLGGGTWMCGDVIVGAVGGTREGTLYRSWGGNTPAGATRSPPQAQFAIPGLENTIDGLWVHRGGHSILTRARLPKRYTEVMLPDDAYMARFRVAVASPDSEAVARRLLDPSFMEWHLNHGPQGGWNSQAGTLEISGGVLFIRGQLADSVERLEAFAVAVAGLADRVAAFVEHA
jgi:hypothetical protein